MKKAISHPCKICTSRECAFGAILSHLLSTFSGQVQWFISSCKIANSQIMYTPNSDHLKGFISHRTLHPVTLFFFFDFAWGGDIKHTKLLIFLFHKPFKAHHLTLSKQGQRFYICQLSRTVSERLCGQAICFLWTVLHDQDLSLDRGQKWNHEKLSFRYLEPISCRFLQDFAIPLILSFEPIPNITSIFLFF